MGGWVAKAGEGVSRPRVVIRCKQTRVVVIPGMAWCEFEVGVPTLVPTCVDQRRGDTKLVVDDGVDQGRVARFGACAEKQIW